MIYNAEKALDPKAYNAYRGIFLTVHLAVNFMFEILYLEEHFINNECRKIWTAMVSIHS
jgi:hypothetical protein